MHTSGSLGIAGGVHAPQRVFWVSFGTRYEIVFHNVLAGEVVLRDPSRMRCLGRRPPGIREIEFRAQVRSQVELGNEVPNCAKWRVKFRLLLAGMVVLVGGPSQVR